MNLLLLTSTFPYLPGEPFLEDEIGILAETFENITIVPLNLSSSADKTRPPRHVPKNVSIVSLPQHSSKSNSFINVLRNHGLFRSMGYIARAASHGRCFLPNSFLAVCRVYFRSATRASLLKKHVNLSLYNIYYSYWGADVGLSLSLLKREYLESENKLCVSRVHGYDLYAERYGLRRLPFQRVLLNFFDLVVPCSEQGANYLISKYPRYAQKVHHHHLGVATQNDCNRGSSDGILRIVTCSFIVPVKRLELLIDALMNCKRRIVWTHIGSGPDRDRITKMANQLPANVKPIFLGQLDNKEILNFYRNNPIDLFVNVSSSEGIPVSIMEALSFGIEPIATHVGGVPELVKPSFGILLKPNFDPAELTDIILRHQNSFDRRIKAQNFQRQYFSTTNYHAFVADLTNVFRRKCNENTG